MTGCINNILVLSSHTVQAVIYLEAAGSQQRDVYNGSLRDALLWASSQFLQITF